MSDSGAAASRRTLVMNGLWTVAATREDWCQAVVDLRGTNLYGADMARVRSDAHVRLQDAVLVKVRVHPLHAPAGTGGASGSRGPGGAR